MDLLTAVYWQWYTGWLMDVTELSTGAETGCCVGYWYCSCVLLLELLMFCTANILAHEDFTPLPSLMMWARYGPSMEMVWHGLWLCCGLYMDFVWDITFHIKPACVTVSFSINYYSFSLWDNYVFGSTLYISHSIWHGNDMNQSHTNTI